ncbi:MAG: hypothetical protein V2A69_15945 [Pseudomonadota bacterium]
MAHDRNIPNKLNYHVPAEVNCWFSQKNADGTYLDYLPLGNVVSSALAYAINKIEHKTNLRGMDAKDRTITTERGATLTIVVDELVRHTLKYLLMSSGRVAASSFTRYAHETVTFAAGLATLTDHPVVAVDDIYPTSGEEAYVQGATGDYEVNESTGAITLPTGSQIGDTDEVIVYYHVAVTGAVKTPIMDDVDINGKMIVTDDSGSTGEKRQIEFYDVDLAPDGDIALNNKTEVQTGTLKASVNEHPTLGFGNWYSYT